MSGSLEMAMYGGYKFVGIILVLVVNLVSETRWIWWAVFLYTVAANAFFLVSTISSAHHLFALSLCLVLTN